MKNSFSLEVYQPTADLSHLVESCWQLTSQTDASSQAIILPDGRIDVSFNLADRRHLTLHGLETVASEAEIAPGLNLFCISFRPLAAQYLFKEFLPLLPKSVTFLPPDYFHIPIDRFENMNQFSGLLMERLPGMIRTEIDPRKKSLFDLIYASHGAISVSELSEKVGWSSRQINRYFQDTFGLSAKTYCNVLRFRSSFGHIKAGKLFPEENFADQSHFIREIRKYSGVIPKELSRNTNDRFVQFSTLPPE